MTLPAPTDSESSDSVLYRLPASGPSFLDDEANRLTDGTAIYVPVDVGPSLLGGAGLFCTGIVKAGTLIANLIEGTHSVSEAHYQREQRHGNKLMIMTGVRWYDRTFVCCDEVGPLDYINHSFEPTMLYHLGLCWARRDLEPGTELTVDYGHFLAQGDVGNFIDRATGRLVDGLDPMIALVNSAKELVELLGGRR